MKYKVLLNNKNGDIFDISKIVSKASLSLKRVGACGSLSLDLVEGDLYQNKDFVIENGNCITFSIDNSNIFKGYVFKIESKYKDNKVTITCYDQIKYLLYNYSYGFVDKKASEIISQIASEFKIDVGEIEDTGFVIPKLSQDNKKLLDIIVEALNLTSDNTGKYYCLYDDFGKVTLKEISNMKTDLVLCDNSHIKDFSYSQSIDDSYNRFKIVKDNKESGIREAYVEQNSELMDKWGILQYFEVAQEGLNEGQITEKLHTLSKLKCKEKETMKLSATGEFVRAGESVAIILNNKEISKYFLIDEVKHSFEENMHTMDLTLYV